MYKIDWIYRIKFICYVGSHSNIFTKYYQKNKDKCGRVVFTEHWWIVYQKPERRQRYKKKSKPGRSQKTVLLSSKSWSWYPAPTRESCRTVIPTCLDSVSHPQTLSSYPSTFSRNPPHQTCTRKFTVILTNPIYQTLSRNDLH